MDGKLRLLRTDLRLVDRAGILALRKFKADALALLGKFPVVLVREMRVKGPQVRHQGLIPARLGRLALQGADLAAHFLDDVLHTEQVRLRVVELAQRFLFLRLVLGDTGGFFENRAAIFRATAQDQVDLALLHDGVGTATDTRIHEKLVNVTQTARRLVEEILTLAITIDAARDTNLIPLDAELLFAVGKGHRNLRHAEGIAAVRAAENDVRHFATTQGLCRLLTEHPADSIKDIRLSATIRAHHRRDATVEV